jgi:hypothetical protein
MSGINYRRTTYTHTHTHTHTHTDTHTHTHTHTHTIYGSGAVWNRLCIFTVLSYSLLIYFCVSETSESRFRVRSKFLIHGLLVWYSAWLVCPSATFPYRRGKECSSDCLSFSSCRFRWCFKNVYVTELLAYLFWCCIQWVTSVDFLMVHPMGDFSRCSRIVKFR